MALSNSVLPQVTSTPQSFTFTAGTALLNLVGRLVSFNGRTPRRSVTHEFGKRDGAFEEDMARGPRILFARLEFIGATAANDFSAFEAAVQATPNGLLNHPIAGNWFAFCGGPEYDVDFSRAVNEIRCNVVFKESQLDATVDAEKPNVSTAAQSVTAQQAQQQTSVAAFMGQIAAAQTATVSGLSAVQTAIGAVASGVSAPVDFINGAIAQARGVAATAINALATIADEANGLTSNVTDFVAAANDLFTGNDTSAAGSAASIATLLGIVQTNASAFVVTLLGFSPSPAGAGDAVADTCVLVDTCLTLFDAIQAAIPPQVTYIVPGLSNLILLAQAIVREANSTQDPLVVASQILAWNQGIVDAAAIPGGTVLLVPALR